MKQRITICIDVDDEVVDPTFVAEAVTSNITCWGSNIENLDYCIDKIKSNVE